MRTEINNLIKTTITYISILFMLVLLVKPPTGGTLEAKTSLFGKRIELQQLSYLDLNNSAPNQLRGLDVSMSF